MGETTATSTALRIDLERPPGRLERLRGWMGDNDVDCVLAFGADNVNYLAGYWRYYGGPSGVALGRDGERTLVVMRDEAPVAEALGRADRVVAYGVRGFGIELAPARLLAEAIGALPAVAGAARIGIADGLGGMASLLAGSVSAPAVSADAELLRLRTIKDEDELARILHSYRLCWLGQQAVFEAAQAGASEIEMFSAAQSAAQRGHGEPIQFLTDLLSGPNTAAVCCPIHVAGGRRAAAGDAVIADVVVGADGYWGDTADTHIVGENPEAEAARTELLGILAGAARALRPGVTGAEIFASMSERILSTFPGGEFPHHGGHALGLTSFEDPHLIPGDHMPLQSWMAIAIEPGVYFPGRFGARVENVFIVTPNGGVELREAMGATDV